MTRMIYIPCLCGKIHKMKDPGRNVRTKCRHSGAALIYECHVGDEYRLRGDRKDYILDHDAVEIGRRAEDGITLNHPTLSRHHARLSSTAAGYSIKDLESRNGTFVNEHRLEEYEVVELVPGDLIRLGKVRLRFIAPELPALEETAEMKVPPGKVEIPPDAGNDEVGDVRGETGEAVSATDDPLVGREVGVYRVIGVLSQGGMGRIYRAVHTSLERECVLKTILPDMADSGDIMERFLREITLGAKVWHPNVIAFYDAGQHEDFWFLAMEYFPGQNLWELFSKEGCPASDVPPIGMQAAAALGAAHQEGVVHRDIKPRNILRNKVGMVKVVDFGIAKVCQDPHYSTLTLSGAIVGTPAYMAPEQIRNPGEIDHRIDIYALGAVLYFCVTGKPPYVGRNAGQVLRQVGKSVPRPSQLMRGVPPKLESVIMRAMNPDPGKRYQQANEMRDALEALL